MQQLNFPTYDFKIKTSDKITQIFDIVRRKYVALTPEEWVRQHFIHYLVKEKKFPQSLIAVEMSIRMNKLQKRCDIVGYDNSLKPILIVECKAPGIKISQNTFDQVARYNISLRVKYLAVSNGLEHYFCEIDFEKKNYRFLRNIEFHSKTIGFFPSESA